MLKDIQSHEVKDVGIAIVKNSNEPNDWKVLIINLSDDRLENVIINSTGYGEDELNNPLTTATFRHYIESLKPRSAVAIEMMTEELFYLSHRFWVSFYRNNKIFDKKYVFIPGSIQETFFVKIPFTDKSGVMII